MKNNIRVLREAMGLTQSELCKKLKENGYCIDRTTLSKYETDDHNLSDKTLVALASFFETSTDYILDLTDKK